MPELVIEPATARAAQPPQLLGASIGAVAHVAPDTIKDNATIAARIGVEESWITERIGVRQRHVAEGEEPLTELATEAGARALGRAGLDATAIDLVLVASTTQDELTPNAAPQVAARLGAGRAGAMDIGAACTAYLYALGLATAQVESGRAEHVLVIGAEAIHRFTDPDDRATAALFGDGAGAAVVSACEQGRIGPVVMRSDGDLADLIRARRGGYIVMNGHETYRHAVRCMSEVTLETLERAGRTLADVDLFVYHQANSRIIRAVGQRLGLAEERVVDVVHRYGNTSGASLPIALSEAEADGRLHDGSVVLLGAFGAGATWGGAVLEWGRP